MKKIKFICQFDQMDCGPACVRMVALHHGKDYPLSYLRTLSHLSREGVSVAGIRDALTQIGMESASFKMSLEQLHDKCPLPAILHWEQNHFVVLYDVQWSKWRKDLCERKHKAIYADAFFALLNNSSDFSSYRPQNDRDSMNLKL